MNKDIDIINKLKKTNNKKYAKLLIEKYYDEIYVYVYKQTSGKDIAMDITQEIFISVLKAIERYDSAKSSFRTWLYRVSTNKVIDYYRSNNRHNKHIAYIDIDSFEYYDENDFIQSLENKELSNKILSYINMMSLESQSILRLKIFADKTFAEISNHLTIPESTVKSKYYRLITKISKEFNDEYRDA